MQGVPLHGKGIGMEKTLSVARIKAEFQEKGIRISPELVSELEASYNAPAVSTGRFVLCLASPSGDGELLPVFVVNGKRFTSSPFELVKRSDGSFAVLKDQAAYTDAVFIPRPQFYNQTAGNGIPMPKVAVIVGPGHLRSVVNQSCVYQKSGQACKFCAVQYWWNAVAVKGSLSVAETIEAGFREGAVKHVSLTTATQDTPDRGLAGLVETSVLIRSRAPVPIMLEFEPVTDYGLLSDLLWQAKKAGVTTVSINIECFDERLREDIMPAKGRIAVQAYLKNWEICLEMFGKNQVSTVVVAGIGEDDASILKGVEMAAYREVLTFLVPHSPAAGAVYADFQPPAADRMLHLYEESVQIMQKHGLDLCASAAGCIRGGGFSAIKDVARFGV
jgi:radical SAM protein (TIGR04043 family)